MTTDIRYHTTGAHLYDRGQHVATFATADGAATVAAPLNGFQRRVSELEPPLTADTQVNLQITLLLARVRREPKMIERYVETLIEVIYGRDMVRRHFAGGLETHQIASLLFANPHQQLVAAESVIEEIEGNADG